MKHTSVRSNARQRTATLSQHRPVTGSMGVSIAPPMYGIDFVDRQQTNAESKFGARQVVIQAKLTLGPVGDPYEQEADRVAQQVIGRICSSTSEPASQAVQRRSGAGMAVTPKLEAAIQGVRGHGQPLPDHLCTSMGQAFGADFSGVRIHTDSHADQLNQVTLARAFTTGQDIFFKQGEYNPHSSTGGTLLAHELAHVVQQGGAAVQTGSGGNRPANAVTEEVGASPMKVQERTGSEVTTVSERPGALSQGITPRIQRFGESKEDITKIVEERQINIEGLSDEELVDYIYDFRNDYSTLADLFDSPLFSPEKGTEPPLKNEEIKLKNKPVKKTKPRPSPSGQNLSSSQKEIEEFPALPSHSVPLSNTPSVSSGMSPEQEILQSLFKSSKPTPKSEPIVDPYAGLSDKPRALATKIDKWNKNTMDGSSAKLNETEQVELRNWVEKHSGWVVNIGEGTGEYHGKWQFKVSVPGNLSGKAPTYHITLKVGSWGRP